MLFLLSVKTGEEVVATVRSKHVFQLYPNISGGGGDMGGYGGGGYGGGGDMGGGYGGGGDMGGGYGGGGDMGGGYGKFASTWQI